VTHFVAKVKRQSQAVVVSVTDAAANLTLRADDLTMMGNAGVGTSVSITFGGRSVTGNTYRWLTSEGVGGMDIQVQCVTGTAALSGSAVNTWLNCNTTQRNWSLGLGAGGTTRTKTGWIRFRQNSTTREITSMNVAFTLQCINSTTGTKTSDTK
jgi:hypothetical protein